MSKTVLDCYYDSIRKLKPKSEVEKHLKLVIMVANRVCKNLGSFTHKEDMIQNGNLGLIKAIEKFDPNISPVFSSYAIPWIHTAIVRGLNQTKQIIPKGKGVFKINTPLSLEELSEKGIEAPAKNQDWERGLFNDHLNSSIKGILTSKEYEVVDAKYQKDKNFYEIGEEMGYTFQNISVINKKAFKKLRENFNIRMFFDTLLSA